MWLLHGTTHARAERIAERGPDLSFAEPGGFGVAGNFSFTAEGSPSAVGDSVTYARGKAAAFPSEGGPAVVAVDVPADVVRLAAAEHLALFDGLIEYDEAADLGELIALCGGVVQFDPGPALEALRDSWPILVKSVRGVP